MHTHETFNPANNFILYPTYDIETTHTNKVVIISLIPTSMNMVDNGRQSANVVICVVISPDQSRFLPLY